MQSRQGRQVLRTKPSKWAAWASIAMVVLFVLLLVLAFATPARGEGSEVVEPMSAGTCGLCPMVSAEMSLRSQYLGANGRIFYDVTVSQGSVTFSWESGLSVNLWGSRGYDAEWWDDFDDEIDLTVAWAHQFPSEWGLTTGAAYFAVVEILPADVVETWVKVTTPAVRGVSFYGAIERYTPTSGTEPLAGTMVRFGGSGSVLHRRGALDFALGVFHDSGAFGSESGLLAEGSVALQWKLGAVTLTAPGLKCAVGIDTEDPGKCALVIGISSG